MLDKTRNQVIDFTWHGMSSSDDSYYETQHSSDGGIGLGVESVNIVFANDELQVLEGVAANYNERRGGLVSEGVDWEGGAQETFGGIANSGIINAMNDYAIDGEKGVSEVILSQERDTNAGDNVQIDGVESNESGRSLSDGFYE